MPVILHGRTGDWFRQLRPRLREQPVRWFESRSAADLRSLLDGLAAPLLVIDAGRDPGTALGDLVQIVLTAPRARILVLDPETVLGFSEGARGLGATHVFSGFVPPPVVAELLNRWIVLSRRDQERAGWSRTEFPETETDPWSWLSDYVSEPGGSTARPAESGGGRRPGGSSDLPDSFPGPEPAPPLPGCLTNEG